MRRATRRAAAAPQFEPGPADRGADDRETARQAREAIAASNKRLAARRATKAPIAKPEKPAKAQAETATQPAPAGPSHGGQDREQIVQLIGEGLSNQQIAERVGCKNSRVANVRFQEKKAGRLTDITVKRSPAKPAAKTSSAPPATLHEALAGDCLKCPHCGKLARLRLVMEGGAA